MGKIHSLSPLKWPCRMGYIVSSQCMVWRVKKKNQDLLKISKEITAFDLKNIRPFHIKKAWQIPSLLCFLW